VRLGVLAGLDLPGAIDLAADAVGSPKLRADSNAITNALRGGSPITETRALSVLPPSVPAAMQFAADSSDLASALTNLAQMYQQQAELRLGLVQTILTPLTIIALAVIVGFIMTALFMPMLRLFGAVGGGK
jgi:type IV pilus assembly protein PilC